LIVFDRLLIEIYEHLGRPEGGSRGPPRIPRMRRSTKITWSTILPATHVTSSAQTGSSRPEPTCSGPVEMAHRLPAWKMRPDGRRKCSGDYRQEYRDLPDALRSLRRFIEKVYNEKRLHSALGYLPPSEFETNLSRTNNGKEAASRQLSVWSFFRHREIIRSDVIRSVRERRNRRSPAHRLDEFPVGYSSASCTPALRASASPTGIHSA